MAKTEDKEMMNRKIGERGKEIIDKPTYQKLTRSFISGGGIIIRGEMAKKHLDPMNAGASFFVGAKTAFIRDDATVSEVLEEMYHMQQEIAGLFSEYPEDEILYRREIDAQDYLLKNQKRYKISVKEIEEIKQNKIYWETKLKEMKGE